LVTINTDRINARFNYEIRPLYVSSRLAVHHQEDQLCINSNWYSHALCWLAAANSQST